MKKIISILLAVALLLGASSALVACGGGDNPSETLPVDYTVKLTDYKGDGLVTVAIAELVDENGAVLQQKRVGQDGTAVFNAMPGNYKVNIQFLDSKASYVYDEAEAVFTATKTTAEIGVYSAPSEGTQAIYVPCTQHITTSDEDLYCSFCGMELALEESGLGEYGAHAVSEGATLVELDRDERSYFIFTPTRGGIYQISLIIDGEATFGNYGSPHFVLSHSASDVVDGSFEEIIPNSSIGEGQGGTVQIVLGVSDTDAKKAVIVIERTGNYNPGVPYTEIEADPNLEAFVAESGTYVDIDVTSAENKIFYNEADGYYHYGNLMGPIVLVKIGVVTEEAGVKNAFLPEFSFASYETICTTDSMCKYFYDENGSIVKKERYNNLINTYASLAGTCTISYSESEIVEYKVVPLDQALATAIQNTAEHRMWFDAYTGIFGANSSAVNPELAWLYACCYKEI